MNNTLEGIHSRLDETEDQISNLKDKLEKHPSTVAKKQEES